ncbi:MAG: MATE family efflux transporter [Eubacteriales bacterium]
MERLPKGYKPENPMFNGRELTRLIVPLVIEQTLAMSVGMIDTVMIAGLGEAAVSGVSLVDMINALIINLFAALATGGAVVVSQCIGAKKQKDANGAASQLIFIVSVISVGVMTLCLLFNRPLISLFFGSIEADVMSAASTYFYLTALSFPFLAVYNSFAALFRSMGNSTVSMLASVLCNLLNVAGNGLLIYAIPLGVAGAAISTLISRFAAMVFLMILLLRPKYPVYLNFREKFRPNGRQIHRILSIGIPSGVENCIFSLGRVLVVSIISVFGTTQIAANAVANNLDGIGCIPGQALGLAMITVVGRCIGAGDGLQTRYYVKRLMKITYAIHSGFNILLVCLTPLIVTFYNLSEATEQLSIFLVAFHCLWGAAIWPLAFTLPNALRAANDVKFTMTVSIASMILFRLTLSYIIGYRMGYGAVGVWIAMVVDWICRVTCFLVRYYSGRWRKHALV